MAGFISPIYGGTGSNNGANTLTLGGNLSTSGNFATVISTTATTLPTSGTNFPTVTGSTGQVLTLSSAGTATWSTTAAQTNFTLCQPPNELSTLKMFVNGILISQNAYTYQTTSSFNSTTTPIRYLTYVNTYNGTYAISAGDRIQFVYYY